ncbi:hypothetical protein GQ600_23551 [Phytophthora cactorum]|nr:hypothetical protein GQ600_23551 [Phytophthora cactorum]
MLDRRTAVGVVAVGSARQFLASQLLQYLLAVRSFILLDTDSSSGVTLTSTVFMNLKKGEKYGVSPNRYSHWYKKNEPSYPKCANGYVATKPFFNVRKYWKLRRRCKKFPIRCSVPTPDVVLLVRASCSAVSL